MDGKKTAGILYQMQRRKNDNFVQNLSSGEESDGSGSNVSTSGKFESASSSSEENLPLSTLVSENAVQSQRRDRILWKTKDNSWIIQSISPT